MKNLKLIITTLTIYTVFQLLIVLTLTNNQINMYKIVKLEQENDNVFSYLIGGNNE